VIKLFYSEDRLVTVNFEENGVSKSKCKTGLKISNRSDRTSDINRDNNSDNNFSIKGLLIKFLFLVLWSPLVLAQHEMHNMAVAAQVETMPANDEVLAAAPKSLMLHFENETRLVKLALKDPKRGYIDIDFRYEPVTGLHFMHALPELEEADYFTAEWATLNANGALVKGSFNFSFGENARPPSYYLNQLKQMDHIMSPDYRLLQ
jgi:methionine-rich copper-binding protein CopC